MCLRYYLAIIFILVFFSCLKKTEEDICLTMQTMAEGCEPEILSVFKHYVNQNEHLGYTTFDYQLIESRVKKKISQKRGQKQCERFRDSKEPELLKKYRVIKECTQIKNCKKFADCIITL